MWVFNYINKEEPYCESNTHKELFAKKSFRDKIGLMSFNKNEYKYQEDGNMITYSNKNKTLKEIFYSCNQGEATIEKIALSKDTILRVRYSFKRKSDYTFTILIKKEFNLLKMAREKESEFIDVKKAFAMLKKINMINTNSQYFYGYNKDSLTQVMHWTFYYNLKSF